MRKRLRSHKMGASVLAALQSNSRLFEALFGYDLGHQIIPALEWGQILLRELIPLRFPCLPSPADCGFAGN